MWPFKRKKKVEPDALKVIRAKHGLKIFELNLDTLEITDKGKQTEEKPNHWYTGASNLKNAEKHFIKMVK